MSVEPVKTLFTRVDEVDWTNKFNTPLTTKILNDSQSNNYTKTQWLAEITEQVNINYPSGTFEKYLANSFLQDPILTNKKVYNLKNGKNPEVGDIKAAIKAKESWIHKFKETHYKLVSDTIKFETLQDMSRIELISGSYVIPIDDNNPEPEVGEEESTISTIFPVPDFSDHSMTLERGPTVDSMSKIPIDTFTENFNNNMNIINRFVKLHDRSTKNEISKLENQIMSHLHLK
jgi:hypothetical protein